MNVVSRFLSIVLVAGVAIPVTPNAKAQTVSIQDRVTWEEAILAFDEGERTEALVLLEEVLEVTGPVPAILMDAASMAFESREYLKAEQFIMSALETDDDAFKATPQYDDAFRLAARIQRTLRPLRESLSNATTLPFTDSLSRGGFAVAMKDRNSICEWKFERGGLISKTKNNAGCTNGQASSSGRVHIQMTIEKRGGGSKATAGIVFGGQDENNYQLLRVHPGWEDVGDMSLVLFRDGRETLLDTSIVYDSGNRPLRRWSDKGPWQIAVEIRGRRIDWFLNNQHVGTAYAETEIRGEIMAAAGGPDGGEFLFKDLVVERISLTDSIGR